MDRATKITVFSTLTFVGVSAIAYRSIKRNQSYNLLVKKLETMNVVDNKKTNDVLNGVFHTSLDSSKGFAMLSEAKKQAAAAAINKAVVGVGTDEDAIYSALGSLNDKVAISQVAAYYKAKYKLSLLQELKEELSSSELAESNKIINSKIDVRWLE
jgi:hypothetical protein